MAGASAIDPSLAARIEALLGSAPRASMPLHGGCIAAIERLELADGTLVVAKRGHGGNAVDFRIEAFMLQELQRLSRLPVPTVLAAEPDLLLLEYLPHATRGRRLARRRRSMRPSSWPPCTRCAGPRSATAATR
jgi:hypothetical protein